ncbi:hypothetical protein KC316_g4698, partial [Hortaea werneckii]
MPPEVPTQRANQYSDLDISGGTNILGNVFGGLTINPKTITRSDFAGTYSHMSLRPVAGYVVRQELQQEVEERIREARASGGTQSSIVVLVGLGGAGKSQLALNYIQTRRTEYNAVFWVDARLRESLERDYVQIARLLSDQEHTHQLEHAQGPSTISLDIDQVVTTVNTCFAGRAGRWLIVYDNADSLDDESDPYFVDLQHYLPDASGVEIILSHTEAVEIFVRCGKFGDAGRALRAEAELIVAELGYLALAVTLAGAYVAATPRYRSNITEYLPEYRRRRKALLGRKAKRQIHQYGESVLSTWETSGNAIDDWERFLSPEQPLEEVLDEALEALSTYSFIQWKEEQAGFAMHKLVHAWGFDRLEAEEQGRYSQSSLALLRLVIRDGQLDPIRKSRVTPHISSSVVRLREWDKASTQVTKKTLNTIWSLANFVRDTGQYQTEYELRAFEEAERAQAKNEDEAEWLEIVSNLAAALQSQGKYEAAEAMNRRALGGLEKLLGKEHPSTLTSVNNL